MSGRQQCNGIEYSESERTLLDTRDYAAHLSEEIKSNRTGLAPGGTGEREVIESKRWSDMCGGEERIRIVLRLEIYCIKQHHTAYAYSLPSTESPVSSSRHAKTLLIPSFMSVLAVTRNITVSQPIFPLITQPLFFLFCQNHIKNHIKIIVDTTYQPFLDISGGSSIVTEV